MMLIRHTLILFYFCTVTIVLTYIYTSSLDASQPQLIQGLYQPDDTSFRLSYSPKGYAWENNTLGISDKVPQPWIPVAHHNQTLTCWGREYQFTNGLLPDQIRSQGIDIFARPPSIDLIMNGKAISDRGASFKIVSQTETKIEVQSQIENSEILLKMSILFEFDGFMRFDFNIIPKAPTIIDKLTLSFPFHKKIAKYYSRYINYDFINQRANRKDIVKALGFINKYNTFSFTPTLWTGNKNVGIEWISETDVDIHVSDPSQLFRYKMEKGRTVLNISFIDYPVKLSNTLTYSFALLPTPTKKIIKDWRTYFITPSLSPQKSADWSQKVDTTNWHMLYFGNFRTVPLAYPGLPTPASNSDQKEQYLAIRASLAKDHITYMPYSALYLLAATIPELEDYQDLWATKPARRGGLAWMEHLEREEATQPVAYHHKSLHDFVLYTHHQDILQHQIKAMYFDLAMLNEIGDLPQKTFHQATFDISKKLYYPLYAHREFLKRYWTMTKAINPNFIIVHHSSKVPYISGAYIDFSVTGEDFNMLFRSRLARTKVVKDPNSHSYQIHWRDSREYVPDYLALPEHLFQIGFLHIGGYVNMILPQISKFNRDFLSQNSELYKSWTRRLLGICLIYDIPVWRTRIHQETMSQVLSALNKFGRLDDEITVISDVDISSYSNIKRSDIKTSAYIRKNKTFIVFLNYRNKDLDLAFQIPDSWLFPQKHIKQVINTETKKLLIHKEKNINLTIPSKDFVTILVYN